MENLQVNKKYKIEEGEYKDWLLWIEKYNANDEKLLGDEKADYYLIFLQNPQTSTLYDNFAENWEQVLNECSDYKLSLYVSEKRELENKNYICPICGYDGLEEPPYDETGLGNYDICPCCGYEFGTGMFYERTLG